MAGRLVLLALEHQHIHEVLGHSDVVLRLLEVLEKHGVLAHIHILSHSNVILCLIKELSESNVI